MSEWPPLITDGSGADDDLLLEADDAWPSHLEAPFRWRCGSKLDVWFAGRMALHNCLHGAGHHRSIVKNAFNVRLAQWKICTIRSRMRIGNLIPM